MSRRYWQSLVPIWVAAVVFLCSYYSLLPVVPMQLEAHGWQKAVIGVLASVFSVTSLLVRPLAGVATDRSGPPKLLRLTASTFLVVPLILGLGKSFLPLAAGQVVAGCCVGAFTVASNGYVTAVAPAEQMGEAVAWFSIAFVAAKGFGPTLGTWLYDRVGFYGTLWAVAALTLGSLGLVEFGCSGRDSEGGRKCTPPERSLRQADVASPSMNWDVVLLAAITLVTVTVSFGATMTFLPIMAKERGILGYRYFYVIQTLTVVAVRSVSGRIVDRMGAFWVILAALLFLGASVGMLAVVGSTAGLVIAAVLYGVGYGASYPSLTATVVKNTPAPNRGKAFGITTAAQDLGLALGQACAGLSQYTSFRTIYLVMAALPLLSIGLLPRLTGGFRGRTPGRSFP